MVRRNFRNSVMAVPGQALPDDLAGQHVQRGEQGGGAVALVVVGHRLRRGPGFIGSDGWVRSSACTEDFSSTHSTIAFSGGFRYRPTTSISFSSNFGSLDSLNVSTRCGFNPRADHTRCTVAADTPAVAAIVRHDQWVWPSGVEYRVSVHDLVDLLLRDRGLAATPGPDLPQLRQALLGEPGPPRPNRRRLHPDLRGDPHIRHTIGRQQQRLGPPNLPMRRGLRPRQGLQRFSLTVRHDQSSRWCHHPRSLSQNQPIILETHH